MNEFTIIANWKMNGDVATTFNYAEKLSQFMKAAKTKAEIVICPPANLILALDGRDREYATGGQNCHAEASGAFTGEISAKLLADSACEYVIIGHSERRQMGENCALAAKKAETAQLANLRTIFCVGENEGEGFKNTVGEQLEYVDFADIIAYEPVWAIGTGKTPTLEEINERHKFIQDKTGKPVVYGGSVNVDNAAAIAALEHVDGLLIGGASLDINSFIEIIKRVIA